MNAPIDLAQLEARILGRQARMHWYTLIVDPQQWRRVAERAAGLGYATYAPMLREQVKGTPRRPAARIVERPALGGYLFVDMPEGRRRFDLFTSDDPGERPYELPEGDIRGYVADAARPPLEPVRGCRGFIAIDGSPCAFHEAVIEDMRLRERNGEFDLTRPTDDGRGLVAKWVRIGAWVQLVNGPFANFFGVIEEVSSHTLIKVGVHIFGRVTPVSVPVDWLRLARSEDHGILISRKNRAKSRSSAQFSTAPRSRSELGGNP